MKDNESGFTLVETLVVLTIIAIILVSFMTTISGLRARDNVDRVATSLVSDLTMIRSRAVSTSKTHRINFLSTTSWKLEMYNSAAVPPAWVTVSETRYMPNQTYLLGASFTNAGSNLEATARGIYVFQGASVGTPYVTIESSESTRTKSVYVGVGGAVEVVIN